jgi:lysophospholipase L1-like esterase
MEQTRMNRFGAGLRAAAVVLAVAPLFAACSSMLDDQTFGSKATPAAGADFVQFASIGTSLSAGFESGGINDSTQREGPMYQLALGMGLTPGVNWFYPSFQSFGCPAPYINPLTGVRVGGVTSAFCGTRAASSARVSMNNTAIPGMRAGHALDLQYLAFPKTDTLKLAQFITGGINPINIVLRQHPTFVTIEVGGNDALGAASNADTTLLTTAAAFTAAIGAIRDSLNTLSPRPKVAIATTPNPLLVPHWTRASVLFCLKTGACPGVPATLPYSLASFTVDASCAPNLAGGIGDGFLIPLATTAGLTGTLAAGRLAKIDCLRDSVLVAVAAAPAPATASAGLRLNVPVTAAIAARGTAFNAAITALATAEGWALADVYAAHTAQVANIPAIPNLANQLALFACPAAGCPTGTATIYSQDGVHFSKAGYRVMALAFQTAINTKYGTTITVP